MKRYTVLEARNIALGYVHQLTASLNLKIVIIDSSTLQIKNGWIFFYDSESYIKTGNISDALTGNLPIFVNKHNGLPRIINMQELESYKKEVTSYKQNT